MLKRVKAPTKQEYTNFYGTIPQKPEHLSYVVEDSDIGFAAGKATMSKHRMIIDLGEKEISLNFSSILPNIDGKFPVVIILTDEKSIPNKYLPAEEIIDRGYGIFTLCIDDVATNDGNFKSGICGHIARSRKKKNAAGKLSVWAWAIMRVLDCVCDNNKVDKSAITIAGHGIYARAVLLASGIDDRVGYVIANNIHSFPIPFSEENAKSSITVRDFPYIYSSEFAENPFGDELDILINSCKAKHILIGCANGGEYFDTEYNKILALSQNDDGLISYHIRSGSNYFSREDWNIYFDFIDKKLKK